jgi:glutathione S-transferase
MGGRRKAPFDCESAPHGCNEQWLDWSQCRLSPTVVDIVLNSVFLAPRGDQVAIERLPELWSILDDGLAGGTPFLAGPRATIADLSLASSVFQLSLANIPPAGRNVADWFPIVFHTHGIAVVYSRTARSAESLVGSG